MYFSCSNKTNGRACMSLHVVSLFEGLLDSTSYAKTENTIDSRRHTSACTHTHTHVDRNKNYVLCLVERNEK